MRLIPWRVRVLGQAARRRAENTALSLVTRKVPLPASVAHKRICFVGASVGRDWRLPLVFPNIRCLAAFQFDKEELVRRCLAEAPDGVILKECAAYFPQKDDCQRQAMVAGWVSDLRQAGIQVALATVVPVTREHADQAPGRAQGLWEFNDWVREFCQEQGLPLLDLEAALRGGPHDRGLRPRAHSGDGLHLSRQTYRRQLDPLIPPLLLRMFTHE